MLRKRLLELLEARLADQSTLGSSVNDANLVARTGNICGETSFLVTIFEELSKLPSASPTSKNPAFEDVASAPELLFPRPSGSLTHSLAQVANLTTSCTLGPQFEEVHMNLRATGFAAELDGFESLPLS